MTWTIFFDKWMRALLTAIIGGVVVAVIVPYVQATYAIEEKLSEKKIERFAALNERFVAYIEAREQLTRYALRERALYGKVLGLTKQKKPLVDARDTTANQLRQELFRSGYYFGGEVLELVKGFIQWQAQYAVATVDEVPADTRLLEWRDQILTAMRRSLYKYRLEPT
jgi:hypothetical protein